jgi:hypothetical protein
MGTSDGGAGSGGAWSGSGRGASDFADAPTEDVADRLVSQGLRALKRDTEEQEAHKEQQDPLPLIAPHGSPLPGLRIRSGSGAGGVGGSGAGGGGGGRRSSSGNSGGGRSAKHAARAGGRALAAGFALQRGDRDALAELGVSLDDLEELSVFDQINLILNVTIPATGSPLEVEMRLAGGGALIHLLKDGGTEPRSVIEAFVVEFVFDTLVAEWGGKFRDGSRPGTTTREGERLLRSSISAYASQVEIPEGQVSAKDFESAIETVTGKIEELAP